VRLDDPEVVAGEYASEHGLEGRRRLYEGAAGVDPKDVAVAAVAEVVPGRVLEVGCGPGELAARLADELACEVVALDLSERMVDLARARGVDARVGDVQALRFADGSFDCAVAAWMPYHVPDLRRGIAELSRVIRPGGRLVAVTNSERHLAELRELVGAPVFGQSFRCENGSALLRRSFAHVEQRPAELRMQLTPDAARAYLEASIALKEYADRIPPFEGRLTAAARTCICVAEKAA
jgi:ubiquinone/menaquinone biosynthesis C-methylase UbiE